MSRLVALLLLLTTWLAPAWAAPAGCTQEPTDAAATQALQAAFVRVLAGRQATSFVSLTVAQCDKPAQAGRGEVVVHPDIAQFSEGELLFTLAHELGHLDEGHLADLAQLMESENGKPPLGLLRQKLHSYELSADLYAARLLDRLGLDGVQEGQRAVWRYAVPWPTLTHPSSEQRASNLATQR